MPAQTILSPALELIFAKMEILFNCSASKRQKNFLSELFRTLIARQGRANFTNLARFSHYSEQTFRRHFSRAFDWLAFNLTIVRLRTHPEECFIGVFDCSFLPKSGKSTWGLDKFFSHAAKAVRTGLEVSIYGTGGLHLRDWRSPSWA